LIEGLQQAKDTRLPQVSIHRQFRILVEDQLDFLSDATLRLVADPAAVTSPGEAVRKALQVDSGARLLLAIGPEGGWNAFELNLLDAHGFSSIGMGARTLRTDTACVALLALIHDALAG
jgi:RsmE family RNA methyltransferase